jgi:hypothetical protein
VQSGDWHEPAQQCRLARVLDQFRTTSSVAAAGDGAGTTAGGGLIRYVKKTKPAFSRSPSMNLALHPRKSGFGKVRQHRVPMLVRFEHAKGRQLEQ